MLKKRLYHDVTAKCCWQAARTSPPVLGSDELSASLLEVLF